MSMRTIIDAYSTAARGHSVALNSSNSTVCTIPRTSSGQKPAFVRVKLTAGSAHVFPGATATSATATTGDTVLTADESFILVCAGFNAVGGRQIGSTDATLQLTPLEEGAVGAPTV